jgi:epoxyqueuosine reductase
MAGIQTFATLMPAINANTRWIKDAARRYGFDHCGIARAVSLDEDARRLERWLGQGFHGGMGYMENHFEMRVDPRKLVPGARSVITLLKNYFPGEQQQPELKIARYAWGEDYHEVIRAQLNGLLSEAQTAIGGIAGRGFVDSAPVLERSWAQRSGLGWIGKNGNLINKGAGSYFFIATLITDIELEYDDPFARDFCGSCTKCIDACPTDAILPDKTINGSQCISYFTIELKEALIPGEMQGRFDNWLFGCDVCQEVCPWNRFSKPHQETAFTPIPEILDLKSQDWEAMSEEAFRKIFKRSPLSRAKHKGILRNLRFLKSDENEPPSGMPGSC